MLDQTGVITSRRERRRHQRPAEPGRVPGDAGDDRHLSQPGAQHERARQGGPSVERRRSAERALRFYDVVSDNARGAGTLNAPVRIDRPRQPRSVDGGRQRVDDLVEHRQRNARAGGARRPQGVLDRSDRPAGHDRGRGDVWHVLEQPDAAREHDLPGGEQPVAPRRRARAARRYRLPLQRRHHHVPAHVPRQLHILVAGQLPDRQLQRLRADVRRSGRRRRPTPTSGFTSRTSGAPARD